MTSCEPRILVIGRTGQLAQALGAQDYSNLSIIGRPAADLAAPETLLRAIDQAQPDVIINAGAYTSVDGAESDVVAAFSVNRDGPAELARLCAAMGLPLVHVSTDCVFDGMKPSPYVPDDAAAPLSVYGQSKWEGEKRVAEQCSRHLIVRVSWVFSEFGGNFVRTMLQLSRTRGEIVVVQDQVGFPTYCPDIAKALIEMAIAATGPAFQAFGTYHLAGSEAVDRAEMARLVFAESASSGGPTAHVKPVLTRDYPAPAQRPLNARLDSTKTINTFGLTMPAWSGGLRSAVRSIVGEMKLADS